MVAFFYNFALEIFHFNLTDVSQETFTYKFKNYQQADIEFSPGSIVL